MQTHATTVLLGSWVGLFTTAMCIPAAVMAARKDSAVKVIAAAASAAIKTRLGRRTLDAVRESSGWKGQRVSAAF